MTSVLDAPPGAAEGDGGGADAFRVLGLPYSPDLDDEDVRRAYLRRMRAVHPDNGGDGDAAAAVTAAYEALRSGVRRGELLTAAMVDRGDPAPPRRARRARRGGAGRPHGAATARGGVPDAARRAELRAKVAAARAEQGLPPFITDEVTLSKIADLLIVMQYGQDAGFQARRTPRPLGAAWPGWDAPWWDAEAGAPGRPREVSAWRREGRRRYMEERERARGNADDEMTGDAGGSAWRRGWARVRHGRPGWLAVRVVLSAVVPLVAELTAPGDPAVPALAVGAVTWLVLTARFDLAPRARR